MDVSQRTCWTRRGTFCRGTEGAPMGLQPTKTNEKLLLSASALPSRDRKGAVLQPPDRTLPGVFSTERAFGRLATLGEQSHRTAKAIAWIGGKYAKPLRVEDLVAIAGLGVSRCTIISGC